MNKNMKYINREISWLSFNERVLQEALDKNVPLMQRVRFLGIFSNNLDEFFRVRVATTKRMANLNKSKKLIGDIYPKEVLQSIQKIVVEQQEKHLKIYSTLVKELEKHKIFLINEKQITKEQGAIIKDYYNKTVSSAIVPIILQNHIDLPNLRDKYIYFTIKMTKKNDPKKYQYALIEGAPTDILPRFFVLPPVDGKKYIILLDDIIRFCLADIFSVFDYDHFEAFTIKVTKDAELDIDDDISKSFVEKMALSLKRRRKAKAVRLVYDSKMPQDLLQYLIRRMELDKYDSLIAGGRYHNFRDFIDFPSIGSKKLENKPTPPLPCPQFQKHRSMFSAIKEKDVILHYPYQSFSHYLDLLREAAIDPDVTEIKITIYRLARRSRVINALINAVRNGKKVTVVIEIQARFDESSNIEWSNTLQEEGVKVIYGVSGLKVHSKLTLITRKENGSPFHYAYVGTGNFHEGTAKIYCDEGLFTADKRITQEVAEVFKFFNVNYIRYPFKHLVLSPFEQRNHFYRLIEYEIEQTKKGKKALLVAKLNSLVDEEMIDKLYHAGQNGVKIRLIIRGICSLIPGVKGLSENIKAISIVDKYLEHSRIMMFHHGGKELFFISSADWMPRNLDTRIEVTCPIYDEDVKQELKQMLNIQLKDNTKARLHDDHQLNIYKKRDADSKPVRAQIAYYNYLKRKIKKNKKK